MSAQIYQPDRVIAVVRERLVEDNIVEDVITQLLVGNVCSVCKVLSDSHGGGGSTSNTNTRMEFKQANGGKASKGGQGWRKNGGLSSNYNSMMEYSQAYGSTERQRRAVWRQIRGFLANSRFIYSKTLKRSKNVRAESVGVEMPAVD